MTITIHNYRPFKRPANKDQEWADKIDRLFIAKFGDTWSLWGGDTTYGLVTENCWDFDTHAEAIRAMPAFAAQWRAELWR